MTEEDKKLKKALWHVLKHENGYLKDLGSAEAADYLAGIGIIAFGIDAEAKLRYKRTAEGYELAKVAYSALCAQEIREYTNNCGKALA